MIAEQIVDALDAYMTARAQEAFMSISPELTAEYRAKTAAARAALIAAISADLKESA